MNLKRLVLALLLLAACTLAVGQDFNTNDGDWGTAAHWNPDGVPSGTGTDVTISDNVTVASSSYTIGNVSVGNNKTVTISSGATLTLGSAVLYDPPSSTTKKSLTFSNSGTLSVAGTLYIYGDLIVNNSLTLNITGTMIVYGDIQMVNGGSLAVSGSGSLTVGGNLTGGNNTQITTSGTATIGVGGSISIGGGTSSISGPNGSITAGGGCTCTACGGTCPSTVTPVLLESFDVEGSDDRVVITWSTTMEENFNKFIVERSNDGTVFEEIAQIQGQGRDVYDIRNKYAFEDRAPIIGYNYYRLKAVDRDDRYEYFFTRSVRITGKKTLNVYPNPALREDVLITTNFNPEEGDRVAILNTVGVVLIDIPATSNQVILKDASDLKPGMYYVRYTGATITKTTPLVIR